MFIYNIALTTFFWTLFTVINTHFKSLYTFNGFYFNPFSILLLTTILFSMAGVPPFIGFFSKLFIIGLLVNNHFFLLYTVFFAILFIGLYFYIQNVRFIHSTSANTLDYPFLENERHVITYYYYTISIITVFALGVIFVDDVLLIIAWIFN